MSTSIPLDRALLLCIDAQPVFLEAISDGPSIFKRCQFAVAAAVEFGLPLMFTEQVPFKLGGISHELTDLAPEAAVIAKDSFSALDSPEIQAEIAERQTEHLLLAGVETSICIYQTALAAIEAEMHVTIFSDAVGARRGDDAETVLRFLQKLGCNILPSETVFYALLGGSTHPFFREFTKLVKFYG